MTTPPERSAAERYADLTDLLSDSAGGDDLALTRLIGDLDHLLHAYPAPSWLVASIEQHLRERTEASPVLAPATPLHASGTLSRREALKVGAGGMAWLLALGHVGPAVASELARLAQDGPMTGARLAGILQTERARWNALLAQVGVERMEEPGVEGEWSMKQLVAHLTWYEQAVVEGAQQVLGAGSFTRRRPEGMGVDEMNAQIAAESRARPVDEVMAESERVFAQLVGMIAICPQELLNDPRRLGLPDDAVPWMLVANNSYAHYREHEAAVRAWLDRDRSGGVS